MKNLKRNKANNFYNFCFAFLTVITFYSCSINNNIDRSYVNFENNFEINLKSNTFLIIDKSNPNNISYKCCDTISYGFWEKVDKGNFFEFNSPESYNTNHIDMEIIESKKDDLDSVYLNIDSPISENKKRYNQKESDLFYLIEVSSNDVNFDVKLAQKKWESNKIKFLKPKNIILKSISILIIPKTNINLRKISAEILYTIPHYLKDNNSNNFDVRLPTLTYKYLTLERLKKYYVKVNKNGIIWYGDFYTRKEN